MMTWVPRPGWRIETIFQNGAVPWCRAVDAGGQTCFVSLEAICAKEEMFDDSGQLDTDGE